MKRHISKISLAWWPRSTLSRAQAARAGGRTLGALAATAGLLGFSGMAVADAAQAQTEVLAGTATTTSGSWYCIGRGLGQSRGVSVSFQASGTATGPYPGSFTETGGASLHGNYGPIGSGSLGIGFTITSGTTTITGRITRNPLYGGVYCGGSLGFSTSSATYTATIQAPGTPAQTITGAAAAAGDLQTQSGSQASLNATLTLP